MMKIGLCFAQMNALVLKIVMDNNLKFYINSMNKKEKGEKLLGLGYCGMK